MNDLYTHTHLDLGPGERFDSLRRTLGVTSFGINLMRLEPGQRGRIHAHREQEEVYVVLAGELTLAVEGDEVRFVEGDVVRVPSTTRRQLINAGESPLRMLALGGAGEHAGRDGIAWRSWDEPADAGRPPADVPLPEDSPPS